jgi:cell division septation protein DedD
MSNKATKSKKKDAKKKKAPNYTLEFTRGKLMIWSGVVFLVMIWMFTLGVLVGRDLSPVRFDVKKLKQELIALKQKALKTDHTGQEIKMADPSEDPDLDFYEVLTDREKEVRQKTKGAKLPPAKPDPKPQEISTAAHTEDKNQQPRIKLAEVNKDRARLNELSAVKDVAAEVSTGTSSVTIQVASLRSAEEAVEMIRHLKGEGFEAYSVTVSLPGEGTYHRVRVGHFLDSSEASRVAARLKRAGYKIMIFRE